MGFPNCPHVELIMVEQSPSFIFSLFYCPPLSFSVGRSRRFYSGNNQSSLSASLQATCHCTLLLCYKTHFKTKSLLCLCLCLSCVFLFACVFLILCSAHICVGQSVAQKEDWGALTLMDLLWSVLKHENLSLLNCTQHSAQ